MEIAELILEYIKALSWPTVAIVILFMFKNEFVKIVQRLAHLKYKDLELDFNKVKQKAEELQKEVLEERSSVKSTVLSSLEDQILETIERAPSAAILLAWSGLETAMVSAVSRLAISPEPPSYRSPMHNMEVLSKYSGISKNNVNLIQEMRLLRNKVAHERDSMLSITPSQALDYANIAIELIQFLEHLKRNG